MGQKVSPIGFRVGINKSWDSTWIASKEDFAKFLLEDNKIRKFLNKEYAQASISKITIERTKERLIVNIFTGRPALLIGQNGANVEVIKKQVNKIINPTKSLVVNIKEVKKVDLDAQLVAEGVAAQLEKRVAFRRALKQAIQKVMKAGAKGCKVQVSGVVDGANTIARTEKYMEGSLPLQTIRADIDYGTTAAYTNYGKLGIKCWIYKGDILGDQKEAKEGKPNVNA